MKGPSPFRPAMAGQAQEESLLRLGGAVNE